MKNKVLQTIALFSIIVSLISIISSCIELDNNKVEDIAVGSKDKTLVINEVLADNNGGLIDEDGEYTDWIEIYNYGDEDINLEGYGLSDDLDDTLVWTFPNVQIKSNSFLVVRASGKNRKDNKEYLHTNFNINKNGEHIALSYKDGEIIDSLKLEECKENISYGRKPDGQNNFAILSKTTPGQANKVNILENIIPEKRLETPKFSHNGGVYKDSINLSLSTEDESIKIFYTLDGSEPTLNSEEYTKPIVIEPRKGEKNQLASIPTGIDYDRLTYQIGKNEVYKGTVIRARAYKNGVFSDEIVTNTYFINPNYTLPIISLSTDKDNLFGYKEGIYVPGISYDIWRKKKYITQDEEIVNANYFQKGKEWEREASFEFFENDGTKVIGQNVGIRISGGMSRKNPAKSLKIFARSKYDDNKIINYDLFENESIDTFKTIKLRNSGNDFNQTMIKDAMVQSLLSDLDISTQNYRPAILFINGEYWGIHNIRESLDEYYIQSHYNIDKNDTTIIKISDIGTHISLDYGDEKELIEYKNLINFAKNNDMRTKENYEYIKSKIDIENLMQYIIVQTYINNIDWPQNNARVWKFTGEKSTNKYSDGKWRYMIFDTDLSFYNYKDIRLSYILNPNSDLSNVSNEDMWAYNHENNDQHILIRKIFENDEFKKEFIDRFYKYLDTIFEPKNVINQIKTMASVIEPEIDEHLDRWAPEKTIFGKLIDKISPSSEVEVYDWQESINELIEFAEQRPKYIREYLEENFKY